MSFPFCYALCSSQDEGCRTGTQTQGSTLPSGATPNQRPSPSPSQAAQARLSPSESNQSQPHRFEPAWDRSRAWTLAEPSWAEPKPRRSLVDPTRAETRQAKTNRDEPIQIKMDRIWRIHKWSMDYQRTLMDLRGFVKRSLFLFMDLHWLNWFSQWCSDFCRFPLISQDFQYHTRCHILSWI